MPPNFEALFKIASNQQGCFTASQAKKCDYSQPDQAYHVKAKNWHKLYRGIFCLAYYPFPKNVDLVVSYLWSFDMDDNPVGVFSHATALSIHDLSDYFDNKLHMTVPPKYRRRSLPPYNLVLHKTILDKNDIQKFGCYSVTTPLKTILDLIESGAIEKRFLIQTLTQAINRGLIAKNDLKNAIIKTAKLSTLLDKAGINV